MVSLAMSVHRQREFGTWFSLLSICAQLRFLISLFNSFWGMRWWFVRLIEVGWVFFGLSMILRKKVVLPESSTIQKFGNARCSLAFCLFFFRHETRVGRCSNLHRRLALRLWCLWAKGVSGASTKFGTLARALAISQTASEWVETSWTLDRPGSFFRSADSHWGTCRGWWSRQLCFKWWLSRSSKWVYASQKLVNS